MPSTRAPDLRPLVDRLASAVERLRFSPPVAYVYNPLRYARPCVDLYLERYARRGIDALFLGMNPGPFGMAQTGVPFGEVKLVREWLCIEGRVTRPDPEHPKRPVLGFECARSEISGLRLWSYFRDRFGTPEAFFRRFFVWNYCPLLFLQESGANLTPDKLKEAERRPLLSACDAALRELVVELRPARVIGIGGFARRQAERALAELDAPPAIGEILHPSPASPKANQGWARVVEEQLGAFALL